MAYLTPSDLLIRFGAEELAQVADRGTPRLVTVELLKAAVAGADLSVYTAAEVKAVSEALSILSGAIEDACSMIDGYVSSRYSTPLPNPPKAVTRMAGDIARYYLYDDHATESVKERYDAAITVFRDVSAGKVALGVEVPAASSGDGSVEIVTGGRAFSRQARGL
jgi:phage gp36-like protein